jgi:hypothetical protein
MKITKSVCKSDIGRPSSERIAHAEQTPSKAHDSLIAVKDSPRPATAGGIFSAVLCR